MPTYDNQPPSLEERKQEIQQRRLVLEQEVLETSSYEQLCAIVYDLGVLCEEEDALNRTRFNYRS